MTELITQENSELARIVPWIDLAGNHPIITEMLQQRELTHRQRHELGIIQAYYFERFEQKDLRKNDERVLESTSYATTTTASAVDVQTRDTGGDE